MSTTLVQPAKPVARPTLYHLKEKGVSHGLTDQEKTALDQIYAELETETMRLAPEDVDAMAERYSEGRRAHYHSLPIAQNFHD